MERLSNEMEPFGDNNAVGDNSGVSESAGLGGGSLAKKVVMNVYSAVALSIRTNIRDRNMASGGSF